MMRHARCFWVAWAVLFLCGSPAVAQPDPSAVGAWSSAPSLPWVAIAAHMLPTGKVLVVPGDAEGTPQGIPGDVQLLWDPATGTTESGAPSGYDIYCSGHCFLADGRLFVAGGHKAGFVGLANVTAYDAVHDTWSPLPSMNAGRWYPTTTPLANGDVLVVSGNIDRTVGVNRVPQVFETASGTWRDLTNALLSLDLYPQMHLAPNGQVFNPGPSDVTRYLNTSGPGAWSVVANRQTGYRAYGTSVLYDDGKVLALGGGDPPTNAAEVIDLTLASPAWRSVAPMAHARRNANATILPDGKVLVTGGSY